MIKQEDAVRAGLLLIVRWTRTMMCSVISVTKRSCLLLLNMALPSTKKKNVLKQRSCGFFVWLLFFVTWSVPGNLPVGLSATLKTVEEFYLVPLDSTKVCNTGAIILPVVRNFCFMEQC